MKETEQEQKKKQLSILTFLIPLLLISLILLLYVLKPATTPTTTQYTDIYNSDDTSSAIIVVYGDSRTGHDVHEKIVGEILDVSPIAVFHTGDLVEDGNDPEQWDTFNKITSTLLDTTDFYPAVGNHERNSSLYYDNFELPMNEQWYSVEYEDIHFIVLDSNTDLSIGSEQYEWLLDDLENNDEEIIVSIVHHPPFSVGKHGEDQELQSSIVPLFEEYNVDLVFNGHDHNYQRNFVNNVYYIVTGGGGAPLYSQTNTKPYNQKFLKTYHYCMIQVLNDELMLEVYDYDSKLIDEITLNVGD